MSLLIIFAVCLKTKSLCGLTHDFVLAMGKLLGKVIMFLPYPGRLSKKQTLYTNSCCEGTVPESIPQLQSRTVLCSEAGSHSEAYLPAVHMGFTR